MTRSQAHVANDAWESLLRAHAVLMKRFMGEDIWGDLSMREYDVLYTLSKSPDPMRMVDLGRGVLLSQPALSRLVARLESWGLVARSSSPRDGRGVCVALTEPGRLKQKTIGRLHAAGVAEAMTQTLDDAALAALESICRRLADSDPRD
jgi:DNA-binding MarR family transcriptional regulator